MARGRRKKAIKTETLSVDKEPENVNVTLPLLEDIVSHKDSNLKSIKPVSAPLVSSAEYPVNDDTVKDNTEKPSNKSFEKRLPEPQVITHVIKPEKKDKLNISNEVKPEVTPISDTEEKKKTEDVSKDIPATYPPKIANVISKLRMNPAYRYLPTQSLIRIASSKLRSRYFFTPSKNQSGVNPNFTIK